MDAGLALPNGLTSRGATREDVDAITELIAACELDLDGEAEIDAGDVEMSFGVAGYDPALDCVLVHEVDRLVGWAEVHGTRAEADTRPSDRGRGIGAALLRWTEDRARRGGQPSVDQMVTDANVAAAELFRRNGYRPTETAWLLQIRFDGGPPPEPDPPQGITIRPFERGRDERAAHRVIEDAFGEWIDRTPQSFEGWVSGFPAHQAFSPDLSPLAFDGDELVGAIVYLDYPDADEGWVQQLATKATHRHRGIARALLHTAFGSAYANGKRACGLSTNSRTGALSLYEKVGMHVRRSYTRWSKPL
ncbi:MAG TPA: GNAT family N-acetyltransferase [Actinomycetota bacterium]|nr:GNAT family N-acetyltransferase [Actinomycetota bacterium]